MTKIKTKKYVDMFKYIYILELPGAKIEYINVELTGDELNVSYGKRNSIKKEKEPDCITKESEKTKYAQIRLSGDTFRDEIHSKYYNGILTITVPRKPTLKIKVEQGTSEDVCGECNKCLLRSGKK